MSDAPKYQCSPPFRGLRDALDRLLPNPYAVNALVESEHLQNAADAVGQVTAVDGATVLDMSTRSGDGAAFASTYWQSAWLHWTK